MHVVLFVTQCSNFYKVQKTCCKTASLFNVIVFAFKESKFESLDVESEKASEKTEDEEDNDSVTEDKKEESDEEMERDSGDEAVSDSGERSQSEREEPATSMKEFLLDRAGIAGVESVPGSPASQMSQG